ncbi:hypothetical protein NMY22_g9621 [Coprinellus aureogranulatus]|nr:hypothetical protein NMY22_g9621 [Coprinellus aureogranulatus]
MPRLIPDAEKTLMNKGLKAYDLAWAAVEFRTSSSCNREDFSGHNFRALFVWMFLIIEYQRLVPKSVVQSRVKRVTKPYLYSDAEFYLPRPSFVNSLPQYVSPFNLLGESLLVAEELSTIFHGRPSLTATLSMDRVIHDGLLSVMVHGSSFEDVQITVKTSWRYMKTVQYSLVKADTGELYFSVDSDIVYQRNGDERVICVDLPPVLKEIWAPHVEDSYLVVSYELQRPSVFLNSLLAVASQNWMPVTAMSLVVLFDNPASRILTNERLLRSGYDVVRRENGSHQEICLVGESYPAPRMCECEILWSLTMSSNLMYSLHWSQRSTRYAVVISNSADAASFTLVMDANTHLPILTSPVVLFSLSPQKSSFDVDQLTSNTDLSSRIPGPLASPDSVLGCLDVRCSSRYPSLSAALLSKNARSKGYQTFEQAAQLSASFQWSLRTWEGCPVGLLSSGGFSNILRPSIGLRGRKSDPRPYVVPEALLLNQESVPSSTGSACILSF